MAQINICLTCLANDRKLIAISELKRILQYVRLYEDEELTGGMCWECQGIVRKFYKFKLQAGKAQHILNSKNPVTSLSSLQKTSRSFMYYEPNDDPLTNDDEENKFEVRIIKEEYNEEDQLDNDSDFQSLDVLCTDKVDSKEVTKNPKKAHKSKRKKQVQNDDFVDEDIVREKFEKVIFSHEEMEKNREEKRSHPNFKKIPYKCDSCVLGFTRKETYDLHIVKKHDESIGAHLCPVCQIRFTNIKSVERHKKKHYTCYRCRLCRYETLEVWSAINHCRLKHRLDTKNKIHCDQCPYVVKSPDELSEHMQTEHTLYCNECGERFKGKNTLRTHKSRIHAMKREFVCDICSKTFVTKTRLESHMVSHNEMVAKKLAYCSVCHVQYKNIYVYRNHLKNSANHTERLYPCPECNKKFASKVYWAKHYNFYHLHKSAFNCELCNKLFISDWRLKNHKQKHHGMSRSRDHTCKICGKKFYTVSTLRGHELTHAALRPFMCELCGDTFKQRAALYTHTRLLHKSLHKQSVR